MDNFNFSPDGYNPENIYNPETKKTSELKKGTKSNSDSNRGNSRKKNTAINDAEKKELSIIRFFLDRRTHIFLGILFICLATYLAITSISHIKNGIEDQSIITNVSISDATANGYDIENIGGPVGAYASQVALSHWIGIGAFILMFYIGMIGLSFLKQKKIHFWHFTFRCLISTVATSIIIGFITYGSTTPLYWGGLHGFYINDIMIKSIGFFGAVIVNILILSLIICLFFNDLRKIYQIYKTQISSKIPHYNSKKNTADINNTNSDTSKTETTKIVNEFEQKNNNSESSITTSTTINPPHESTSSQINIDLTNDNLNNDNNGETSDEISININAPTIELADEIKTDVYDPTAELSRYRFPTLDLLIERVMKANSVDQQEQEENKERITKTLRDYDIAISHIEATVGPTVTLYEIIPAEGVRIAKIKRLEDDIALSLAALGIRIIAPIPGKGTIGIEVPNKDPQTVSFRSIISSKKFQECKYDLPMAMGTTISNEVFIADLTKMPHLLVAGATGQGKSVGLNAIIASLLYKKHPAELKFVLIDPKMVEFSLYSKLERHYLAKLPDEDDAIITDPSKVVTTLNSLCVEMDNRYGLLRDANVRSLAEYNAKFIAKRLNPEKGHRYLPYIVMIVDEFADLIMTAGKEVETPIARIAQKARAVGMHMIIATQRPSTNVITGIIKANFPGRIAFRVSQMVDSKTILDRTGANQLIGRGDMLFYHNGDMQRVQCAFIDTPEVEAICDCIDEQIGYEHAYYLPEYFPEVGDGATPGGGGSGFDRDPLFEEAARFIITSQTASTSSLQRRYSIGYNRAGKIMDQMEAAGIVGPAHGGKPRQVLMDSIQLERILEANI